MKSVLGLAVMFLVAAAATVLAAGQSGLPKVTAATEKAGTPATQPAAKPASAAPPAAPAADGRTVDKLIVDLGDKSWDVREAAQKRLIEIGESAQPALQAATKSDDPEVRTRAEAALKAIRTRETLIKDLGTIQRNPAGLYLFLSPNGERAAYRLERNGKEILVCDGKEGPIWDKIEYVGNFSNDGKRFGYQVVRGNQAFIAFVGDEDNPILKGEMQAGRYSPHATYSPDGKKVAYPVSQGGEEWMVCDGKEGPRYKSVGPALSRPTEIVSPTQSQTKRAATIF